ncbi:oligopeptide ABC transporter permease OppC [Streptococcus cuniculipharyngis]|uniref:ABC transporter permease n=1 Tax=Streptococcus cuniculipharyngis TaxID=1562651 RepID=A0A5C5SCK1_9STRE|nr:oligopeptide ABC transporter permease OppC [Streptococcus cuniculipharyngis]TWS97425.1 ABC transporter permease [Streptococcus cuniculipharyngis]
MATIDKRKFEFVALDSYASEAIDAPAYSYWRSVFRQFFSKKSTLVMLSLLVGILLMSFIYPLFANYDFEDVSNINDFSKRYIWPNGQYWFGTDEKGQSLFDGVWYGARNSIVISVIATVINTVIGVALGGIWGVSKRLDKILIEVYNVVSNIPEMLIIIVMTYSLGAGFWNLILAFCLTGWLGIAYAIRVQVLRYRDLEYNLASQTLGTPVWKIVTKNLLPQLVSVIVTMVSAMLPSYISYEAFLSFFGLGLPVTEPSLGRLISNYSTDLLSNGYLFWIPLTVLILVSLPLYIVGQNLADASDPRSHR